MAKDFEQTGYKNLELLRFYISKDIQAIAEDKKEDNSEIISCFLGSLVDIVVVLLFDDVLEACIQEYSDWIKILIKIVSVFLLILLFFATQKLCLYVQKIVIRKNSESGVSLYESQERQSEI